MPGSWSSLVQLADISQKELHTPTSTADESTKGPENTLLKYTLHEIWIVPQSPTRERKHSTKHLAIHAVKYFSYHPNTNQNNRRPIRHSKAAIKLRGTSASNSMKRVRKKKQTRVLPQLFFTNHPVSNVVPIRVCLDEFIFQRLLPTVQRWRSQLDRPQVRLRHLPGAVRRCARPPIKIQLPSPVTKLPDISLKEEGGEGTLHSSTELVTWPASEAPPRPASKRHLFASAFLPHDTGPRARNTRNTGMETRKRITSLPRIVPLGRLLRRNLRSFSCFSSFLFKINWYFNVLPR